MKNLKKNKIKKILLTGSSGFVGGYLYKELKKKYEIRKLKHKDLLKKKKLFLNTKFDYFIHAAASTNFNSKKKDIYKNNTSMIKKILLQYHNNNTIFINISSISMFNNSNNKIISSTSKYAPDDDFSKSKVFIEKFLKKKKKFKKIISIRLPGIIGKNCTPNFSSKLIDDLRNDKKIDLYNVNHLFNNVIHIKNLLTVIKKIVKKKNFSKNYFNSIILGSKNSIKLIDYFDFLKHKLGSNSELQQITSNRKSFKLKISNLIKKDMFDIKEILKLYLNYDIGRGYKRINKKS